ncbi:hypothetical protein DXB51_26680 [Bacillus cereus]|uniref:DUF4265 domain-containing protein n=1 Tax=Bacillus luti TaxID=2026191 RepID=A0ABU8HK55_9BACI|nr:hypothetical protein [Bacillus luti]RGN72806.1 hypothetical protein DXB51_26680 [Bacillus cereus]
MSLASYVGCNVKIPLTDPDSNTLIVFGPCFSDDSALEVVQEFQFQTNYTYEVSSGWGIELVEWQTLKEKKEAKEKLLTLCSIMEGYLNEGDYFELFSCWVGDEDQERVGDLKLKINHFNIDEICIPERTLVRIEK